MKLLKIKTLNSGDKKEIETEPLLEDKIQFNVIKFNDKPKPTQKEDIVAIGCFSEFGCEIVGCMYVLPKLKQQFHDKYLIAVGWRGRDYLYRHLVDEFWEINEEFMWLREYARAFHNESKNLKFLEKTISYSYNYICSEYIGRLALGATCRDCGAFWGNQNYVTNCPYCQKTNVIQSLFGDVQTARKQVVKIPLPSLEKQELVKKYLGKNPVGIFARNRQCYGRNLSSDFYTELIWLLENRGFTPIWLGEKQSTLPCPVEHIVDFSRMEESKDLELTLAIVKQLEFTIQFWTASTRLSAMVETPYILFEAPDQIWGNGQEGYRLNLTTFGPKKLVLSNYVNSDSYDEMLKLVSQSIQELQSGNYENMFGLIDDRNGVEIMINGNEQRIGGKI